MEELTLMYGWCKKLKETFEDIMDQYEDYARRKGVSIASSKVKKWQQYKSQLTTSNISSSNYNPMEFQPQIFRQEPPKSTLSRSSVADRQQRGQPYKQRISALRKLNKKFEDQLDHKEAIDQKKKGRDKEKMSAFFVFMHQKRDSIQNEYPELNNQQITKCLGDVWRQLTQAQRQAYENQSKTVRHQFDKRFKTYLQTIIKIQKDGNRRNEKDPSFPSQHE